MYDKSHLQKIRNNQKGEVSPLRKTDDPNLSIKEIILKNMQVTGSVNPISPTYYPGYGETQKSFKLGQGN